MVVVNKKQFRIGIFMTISFFVVLFIMFSPLFGGKNAFEAADDFFNSIAKGSTYYMEDLRKTAEKFKGRLIEVHIKLGDAKAASSTAVMLKKAGLLVEESAQQLRAAGELFKVTQAAIQDSENMFHNKGQEVSSRYGLPEKEALYLWWTAFREIEKDLKRQKKFEEASWLSTVSKKALEVGYNFYGIQAKSASATAGGLAFSLVFYVLYTLWWGYAILFLCEGLGLEMKPGGKKEV
ncbi:MAG: hypothetical protein WHX93_07690 [bacterium]